MAKVIAVGGSNNSNSSSNSSTISACGSNSSCDKDPATYSKEREGFLRDLQHFHETKGTPFKRPPIIGGKEVDLYQLYTLVTGQGGWIKVNSRNAWNQILEQLHLPHYCVNGGVALKQIYLRYLDRWEKLHFLGEEGDRGSDDDEESRHKRWSARALHSVPHTYNYVQHNVADANREYNHLSTTVYKQSDYDRLALSLISSLPNEQDFAINVCTLLSNDGKHTLKLEKYPRLLDYLLGHAGVFCHSSLRKLFVDCYSTVRKHPIHNFWREVLEFGEFVDLTNENNFIKKPLLRVIKKEHDALAATTSSSAQFKEESEFVTDLLTEQRLPRNGDPACETDDDGDSDSDCGEVTNCNKKFKFTIEPSDKDLFCLERGLGTQDYIGQRVLQVTTILRNLSFVEENVSILLKNRTFLRFLLLCSSSRWGHLRNLGLDMLGNVASEFLVKDYPNDRLAVVLLKIITYGLRSEDRTCCISALEVLNKLSQNEANEDVLLRTLEPEVYERVCSFLTIHDVMLLIYTLECLYSLSSLGERSCNLIVNNHGVVDTLVSLVTVEGKSYGPKACIGMKLVETVPGGNSNSSSNSSAAAAATATATSQSQPAGGGVTSPPTSSSSSTTSATTSTTPALVTSTATVPSQTLSTVAATSSIVSTTVSSSGITTSIMSSANKLQTINSCSITPTKPSLITSTPTRPVPIAPQRLVSIAPNSSTSNTAATTTTMTSSLASSSTSSSASSIIQQQAAQQLIQQQHAHQQAIHENEQFALAWLRANFEPCANGKVDHQELYKQYLNACSKIGRRGVISPLHFPRCVRSVFGGTVGPNPMKPTNPTEPQYYEGIKVMAHPHLSQALLGSVSSSSLSAASAVAAGPSGKDTTTNLNTTTNQVGQTTSIATTITTSTAIATNTSLIKSLLATKVNDCMTTTVSMRTATDCQNVAQVVARQQQQRLLAQQTCTPSPPAANKVIIKTDPDASTATPKICRMNGARQLFTDPEAVADPSVTSTTQFTNLVKSVKKEPPQPPPPPLAPLSGGNSAPGGACMKIVHNKTATRIDNEDSDSIGNNSVASSSGMGMIGIGGISSTEDCDNSLTSFEGLLNGMPNMDNPLINEDSDSKDFVRLMSTNNDIQRNKPLRLADLLEKKVEKTPPPIMNGNLGKELRLGDKTVDLVENHIEKALNSSRTDNNNTSSSSNNESHNNNAHNHDNGSSSGIGYSNMIVDTSSIKTEMIVDTSSIKTEMIVDTSSIKTEISDDQIDAVAAPAAGSTTTTTTTGNPSQGVKRPAPSDDAISDSEAKRPCLTTTSSSSVAMATSNNVNGSSSAPSTTAGNSPAPESVSSSNGDEATAQSTTSVTVSTAAAKLFADFAADIMEDEDEEQLMQEAAQASSQADAAMAHHQLQSTAASAAPVQQFLMDGNGQQLLLTQQSHHHQQQQQQQQQHRQIIVSQQPQQQQQQQQQQLHHHQHHQQLQAVKTQTGQTVIVQNHHHHNQQQQQHHRIASAAPQMVLQQNTATGQILLSQGIQGQVQLVASTTQPGQYVLQATGGAHHHHGGTHTTYMVAQPQTAVVHGQPQTVLVAQQGGHHHGGGGVSGGGGTKTIIILQQQPSSTGATSATQHQKVVVTPQGQQMVVTQVHRPVLQTSQVTNNILPSASSGATSVIKATPIAPAPSPLAQAQVQMSPATAPTSVATVVVSQPQPLSHHQQQGQTHTLINNTQNSNVISSTASTTVATMTASVVSTSSSVANGINSSNSSSNDAVRATNVATATAAEKRLQAEDVKPKLVRDMTTPFVCEWGDCHITTKFKSANQVYMHVCEAHCPKGSEEIVCQWERCDNMKRKRFSLMTHIHDKHCNTEAMKQGLIRRKQTKHSSKVEPPPPPAPSTPHPGYAPDAALHAIKRHALEFVNPKELQKAGGAPAAPKQSVLPAPAPRPSPPEQDDNEGPVTKSIRLTASLILRNLVIYSSNCRRYLKHYEPHLANVALSNVESSRTIAQVLYDMNEGSSHR